MMKRFTIAVAAAAIASSVAFAQASRAHDGHDHGHDHAEGEAQAHDHSAKHGGIVEHTEHHHLELVASDGELVVYVTNEAGKPEPVDGAKASATVLSEGQTVQIALASAGHNKLHGTGAFKAGSGTTVVVNVTLPKHETEQVRFRLQ